MNEAATKQTIKCVIVGDEDAKKHELLTTFATNKHPQERLPTVFDNYLTTVLIDDEAYSLGIYETRAQDCWRHLNYSLTDVFVVCFSVISPSSFESIKEKWVPEITLHRPKTPFLIVGTQVDLRDNPEIPTKLSGNNQTSVTFAMGCDLAQRLRAAKYIECSAFTQKGIKNVFDEAASAALKLSHYKFRKSFINRLFK